MAKHLLSDSGCSDIDFENLLLNKSLNDKNFITLSDQRAAEKNQASDLSASNQEVTEFGRKKEAEDEFGCDRVAEVAEADFALLESGLAQIPDGYVVHSENNQLETFKPNHDKQSNSHFDTIEDDLEEEDEEKEDKMRSISLSKISPDNEYNSKTSQN